MQLLWDHRAAFLPGLELQLVVCYAHPQVLFLWGWGESEWQQDSDQWP